MNNKNVISLPASSNQISPELHRLAIDYANAKKDQFNESVKHSSTPPPLYIQDIYPWLWVAHYEGFKNGYLTKSEEV